MRFLPLVFVLILFNTGYCTVEFPSPKGAINDFADVIGQEEERELEAFVRDFWNRHRVAIVVATFPEIGSEPIEDFASRLFETWGVGERGEDRGILIVLALKERKVRVEVGYGLEGVLPDGKVGEIMDRYMLPYFRQGDYGRGMAMGIFAMATEIAKAEGGYLERGQPVRRSPLNPLVLLLPFLLMGFLPLVIFGRRRHSVIFLPWFIGPMGGGGFGGFGGGFGGFGGGLSGGGGATRGF